MNINKAFGISLFGFCERERSRFRSVAALSTARPRRYNFHEPNAGASDLYLVDGDDAAALGAWKQAHTLLPAPTAFVADGECSDLGKWSLRRPIVPSRLFTLLDEMTMQEAHGLHEHNTVDNSTATTTAREVKAESKRSPGRALVVDDSPTARKQIELGLRLVNVTADLAETGEQALELIADNAYDIVFLDVVLPGIDGYQICRSIKKDKLRKHIPVVMLTGKSSPFDRVKGSLAGCNTYLAKPVDTAVFQNVLKKYLNIGVRQGPPQEFSSEVPALR